MRLHNKNFKRMIGWLMVISMIACMMAATAVSTSAATPAYATYTDSMTMTVLVFVIIFLVLALVAVVVVILVVTNKRKENNPGPNTMPSPAPTNAQSFNRVQPMQQMPPQQQAPQQAPQAQNPQQPPVNLLNNSPAMNAPLPVDGAGDTTVLGAAGAAGAGAVGFILQRKNGGEKININKPEFFIGKEKAKVDYCITNNNSISRRHAKIKVRAGKCYISDLGSTNCTYINGTKLSPNQEVALIPGDKIKFSNEEFEFIG